VQKLTVYKSCLQFEFAFVCYDLRYNSKSDFMFGWRKYWEALFQLWGFSLGRWDLCDVKIAMVTIYIIF